MRQRDARVAGQFTVTVCMADEDLTIATSLPRAGFGDLAPDLRTGSSAFDAAQAKVITSLAPGGGDRRARCSRPG